MKFTLITTIAALFLVLGAAPAHAQQLNLPNQFHYAGLTFAEPLTYSKKSSLNKTTLTFNIPEKLSLVHKNTGTVTGEIILLPTITTATVLPVLPTQLPPASFKDDKKAAATPTPTPLKSTTTLATPVSPTTAPTTPSAASLTQTNAGGGLDPEKLFAMSNAFRQARGLPPFQKDERSCSLAASRAPEVAGEVASGNMHAGLRARALPYWNTENIISMRTEEAAFNWWVNDKIHHDAIVGNYTYSCVACSGNNCAQEFTNFQPK